MEGDSQLSASMAKENPLQTTISVEMEVPLCDQSTKRSSEEMGAEASDKRKALKKRRSSLSTKRRSIVGELPNPPFTDSSSESASQGSCASGDQLPSSQNERLQPNPANLKMDTVIGLMEGQIKRLDKEHEEWQELLEKCEKKNEESKMLATNLKLPTSCISEEIKQIGLSEYIKVKPLNLRDAKDQVTDILKQYQFDREACCQDLRLIMSTVESLQFSNKTLASHLQKALDEKNRENEDTSNSDGSQSFQGKRESDPKEAVSKFISNC